MDNETFLILCINCAHPSGKLKYWLLEDEEEETLTFATEQEAEDYVETIDNDAFPVAYKVIEA
jgi:formate dehydrogenase maturation protein FdhE